MSATSGKETWIEPNASGDTSARAHECAEADYRRKTRYKRRLIGQNFVNGFIVRLSDR